MDWFGGVLIQCSMMSPMVFMCCNLVSAKRFHLGTNTTFGIGSGGIFFVHKF